MRLRLRSLVLCYHAVSETWPHPISVSLATLERQLSLLRRRGFRPASSAEILDGRGRLLHVTFDDAFRSVERAVPVLERLQMSATVFVCTSLADTGAPLAVSELQDELIHYPQELQTMRWDQLRELAFRGIAVGAHTVSHPHLTRLSDAEVHQELLCSRQRIEDELGTRCTVLAYPYGEYDARVAATARAAGYAAAFALSAPEAPPNPYALPRVGVWRKDNLAQLMVKTSSGWRLLDGRRSRPIGMQGANSKRSQLENPSTAS